VDPQDRVQTADGVMVIFVAFLLANRAFTYTNANSRMIFCIRVRTTVADMFLSPSSDHSDKIDVAWITRCNISLVFLRPIFLPLVKWESTVAFKCKSGLSLRCTKARLLFKQGREYENCRLTSCIAFLLSSRSASIFSIRSRV
jgi:hypothetical protein